jgi:hypothetical protein
VVEEEPGIAEAFQTCGGDKADVREATKKAFANYHPVPRVAPRWIVEVLGVVGAGVFADDEATDGGRQPVLLHAVPIPWMLLGTATGEHVYHRRLTPCP